MLVSAPLAFCPSSSYVAGTGVSLDMFFCLVDCAVSWILTCAIVLTPLLRFVVDLSYCLSCSQHVLVFRFVVH